MTTTVRRSIGGLAMPVAACGSPGSEQIAAPVAAPWTVDDARIDTADGFSVLVLHDMEGLAGQGDWRTFDYQHGELYRQGQELLAADLNAVIDGLFAGGATEVWVVDGHGSGNPEPDVRRELLDERARQVLRDAPFDTYFDLPESAHYDAVAVVGMHAKTGSGGFASHTYTLGIEFQVHGQPITETELVGLSWGRYGVPVIFASGDDRLGADLATMPWIEFVTVKSATSASSVELRALDEARDDLRAAAQRAVEGVAAAKVMRIVTPVRTTIRTVAPASLSRLDGVPGIDYDAASDSVTFTAEGIREAYDGLTALVRIGTTAYPALIWSALDDVDAAALAYNDILMERWLDVESGRWQAPAGADPPPERRYHGYR